METNQEEKSIMRCVEAIEVGGASWVNSIGYMLLPWVKLRKLQRISD